MCTFAAVFMTHYPAIRMPVSKAQTSQRRQRGRCDSPLRSAAGKAKEKYGRPLQDLGLSLFLVCTETTKQKK